MRGPVTFHCDGCDREWSEEIERDVQGHPGQTVHVVFCLRCIGSEVEQEPSTDDVNVSQLAAQQTAGAQASSSDQQRSSLVAWTLEEKRAILQIWIDLPLREQMPLREEEFKRQFPYAAYRTATQLHFKHLDLIHKQKATIEKLNEQIEEAIGPEAQWTKREKLCILQLCQDNPTYDFRRLVREFQIKCSNEPRSRKFYELCSMWYELDRKGVTVAELGEAVQADQR